jgi:hypothetical protein
MKTTLSVSSAVLGAIVCFYLGLFLASWIGFYEKSHVFGIALPFAALGATLFVIGIRRFYGSASLRKKRYLRELLPFGAAAFAAWLFQAIH